MEKDDTSQTKEICDIYDVYGNRTGKTFVRGEPLSNGQYVMVVDVWIVNSRDDIHDMLDYLVRREGRNVAALMQETFDVPILFVQMLATAVRPDGGELDDYDSAEEYRDAVEACYAELNNFCVDYAVCYEWIENGMEL